MFNAEQISKQVIAQVSRNFGQLLQGLFMGGADVHASLNGENWHTAVYNLSPLAQAIRELCDYANGDSDDGMSIPDTIQVICETLFVPPMGTNAYQIPASFWTTELGQLIQQCRIKMSGDELLTISRAAEIAYGSGDQVHRMKIQRAISRGDLTRYIDVNENNPQKATRVSREELERLA